MLSGRWNYSSEFPSGSEVNQTTVSVPCVDLDDALSTFSEESPCTSKTRPTFKVRVGKTSV